MNELKVDVYKVLQECIEQGIEGGWNKARKWNDFEIREDIERIIKEQVEYYILFSIEEKFKFD